MSALAVQLAVRLTHDLPVADKRALSPARPVPLSARPCNIATGRLTSAVVVDLIGQARIDVLLIGFAVHTEPSMTAALHEAQERGVDITLLLERHADNPASTGSGTAFPDLIATRLAWPASGRPEGASLHAKVLVVDGSAALIGSANVTGAALERNLESGLLITGGPEPSAVRGHVHSLLELGTLRRLP